MTRGKAQSAAAAPADAGQGPSSFKEAHGKNVSSKRRSREAAMLQESNFRFGSVPSSVPEERAPGKAGGAGPAAPVSGISPPSKGRRKKTVSAPPLPEQLGEQLDQEEGPNVQPTSPAADGNVAKKKRTASAAAAEDATAAKAHDEHADSRQKKAKNAGQHQPAPRSGSDGEADGSGSLKRPSHAAGPSAAAAAPATGLYVETGQGSKRNGKAQAQRANSDDGGADGERAADPGGAAAAPSSGRPKKSSGEQGQVDASAPSAMAPCNAATGKAHALGQPHAASLQTEKAPRRHAAANLVASAATAVPPADVARPPAAAATAPQPLQARQEGAAAARRQPPSSSAEGAAGPGPSGSAQEPNPGLALRPPPQTAAAANGASGSMRYPPTGTTPVKVFVPIQLPRLEICGQNQRKAIADLQRQLAEMRVLYDDLKETKIQDLEKVLAQQEEYTAEQVKLANHRAERWKAAAERAGQKAVEAGSKEVKDRIRELQIQTEQLLQQNSDLLFQVTQLQRELALTQQAYHDARAKLSMYETAQEARAKDNDVEDKGEAEEQEHRGHGTAEANEPEQRPKEDLGTEAESGHGHDQVGPQSTAGDAAHQESSPVVTLGAGLSPGLAAAAGGGAGGGGSVRHSLDRSVGLQFPTPSPGVGVQYSNPSVDPLMRQPQGPPASNQSGNPSGQRGLATNCQRVINMLPHLQTPAPSIQSHLRPSGVPSTSQAGTSLSGGHGISTDCLRVVQMLPQLRVPSPNTSSRLASGAVPWTKQNDAMLPCGADASGVTPVAANGDGRQLLAQPGSDKRRSTGSPVDGLCQAGGDNMPIDLSHAHGLGAPEAFKLAAGLQEQYSFVDLNPASARKATRAEVGAPSPAAGLAFVAPEKPGVDQVQRAEGVPGVAALVAAAAATALPPSPGRALQDTVAHASTSVNGCMLQIARHPVGPDMASAARKTAADLVHTANQPVNLHGASPDSAAMAAAAVGHSGSVQGSCNLPGFVARALSQREAPHGLDQARAAQPPKSVQGTPAASPRLRVGDAAVQAQETGQVPQDGQRPQGMISSRSPSPRTAQIKFWEGVLGWKMEPVSSKPLEECRMIHRATGLRFVLRETLLDDDEIEEHDQGQPQKRYFEYIPLDLGTGAARLAPFLKETIVIAEDQRGQLLDQIEKAITEARS
ncbi:hypothetical protein PLESTM_000285200 [Pleodorina starrii]|nr:hypothetical protein PLESTM_000285200 [Pleodorina starrii]